MTSVSSTSALFLAIGSGTWGVILIAALLLLCCGAMVFAMRGMGTRSDRTDKASKQTTNNKTDDDQR